MPFEAKKTKFTVFTLNYELCNLIKRALNMKCESKSTQTYTYQNPGRELIYSFLKVCIVLDRLNKSFLHRKSNKLQVN